MKQRVRWPDPRKPSVIRDESRDLGPGGGSYGTVSVYGTPTGRTDEPEKRWGFEMREKGKAVKWR